MVMVMIITVLLMVIMTTTIITTITTMTMHCTVQYIDLQLTVYNTILYAS